MGNITTLLTPTEYKVTSLVSQGWSEKEIASKRFVSEKTVHAQTYTIRKKLNARSAVDIARIFILSLDNPKKYFAALLFLLIQLSIVVNENDFDLRNSKKGKIVKLVKARRTGRGNKFYA